MKAVKVAIAATLVGGLVAFGAGCGGSDPDAAKTPTDAVTITNGEGNTAEAGGGATEDPTAEGKKIFEGTCQGCHPAGGTEAGMGPKLEGIGWNSAQITKQIDEGSGAMPPGLVAGADRDKVVAYVASLPGNVADEAGAEKPAAEEPATEKPKTETPAPAPEEPATETAAAPEEAAGDAAAGKTFFEGTCQGCHPAGGTADGVGPKLEGIGWDADQISNQVENGGGAMPPGLASGADLENVVAYVLSLQ